MTLIKTCGLFRREDIEAVNDARPDFAGFVVNFPTSHRNVSPEQVCKLRADLRGDIEAVGVFVNEDPQVIASLVERRGIDIVQLHGSEDEAYIESLRTLCDVPIIKAFKIRSGQDVERAAASSADLILLDNGYGTGQAFDWNLIGTIDRPFILAGGLSPDNLAEAIDAIHPWAVDLSSGLETNKVKDADKIAKAVAAARQRSKTVERI